MGIAVGAKGFGGRGLAFPVGQAVKSGAIHAFGNYKSKPLTIPAGTQGTRSVSRNTCEIALFRDIVGTLTEESHSTHINFHANIGVHTVEKLRFPERWPCR